MPDPLLAPELPEFMRSLRAFASVGSLATPQHDMVFAPLVAARKAAAKVQSADARVAAFDATRIRKSLRESIQTLAAQKFPKADAERRALAAALNELAAAAFAALDQMESAAPAAPAARAVRDAVHAAEWERWIASVQLLFNGVDAFWGAARRIVVVTPPSLPKGSKRSASK